MPQVEFIGIVLPVKDNLYETNKVVMVSKHGNGTLVDDLEKNYIYAHKSQSITKSSLSKCQKANILQHRAVQGAYIADFLCGAIYDI